MRLPQELQNAIEKELEKVDRRRLSQASAQLTERYKSGRVSSPVLNNDAHRAAYLALRVPATYAANLHVFSEVHRLAPEAGISSILDVGAGPGTALYAASLRARRRGARGRGALFGLGGLGVLSAGGYLGGHLSLSKGVGPDQTVFDPGPHDWMPAADPSLLADRRPLRVVVDDTPVLLLRDGEEIYAIHDRCSHRGCSLSDGDLEGDEIVCACHGSRFSVRDGSLKHGPATAAQPAFQVRRHNDRIELRRLHPA